MINIESAWIKYNANSNNKNVGDCVKRALSYAYGVDYDEIARRLNRLKRDSGYALYNQVGVWQKFLEQNGAIQLEEFVKSSVTEEEFAENHPRGVYILMTGSQPGTHSHLVCVLNGDIIDSWNSSNYYVYRAWEIKDASLDVEDVSWEDIQDPLYSYIDKYCESVSQKWGKYFTCWRGETYRIDDSTYRLYFRLDTKQLPEDSAYPSDAQYAKRIVVKLNPRLSVEKNIESLQTQLKGRVYNWIYPIEKDIRDSEAIQGMKVHKYFDDYTEGRKRLLLLPEWCREYVKLFQTPEDPWSNGDYYVRIEPLPGDDDWHSSREFESYSLRVLRKELEDYKKSIEETSEDE